SCGDKQTANCSYTDVVTAPTSYSQGYTTHTCTVCGYSYKDSYTNPVSPTTYYTVSFSVPSGVSAVSSQTASANSYITLPSAAAPSGYSFVGWVTSTVSNTTTRPTVLTGSYKVSGNVTLYALYSYSSGSSGSGSEYTLVSSSPADWSGNYVITYGTSASNMYALKGLSGNVKYESSSSGSAVLLSNSGMSYANSKLSGATAPYIFKIAANGSKYTIQNTSTGSYVASYSSYLYSRASLETSYCLWSLSCNNGNITASNSASGSYPNLSFSSSKYFMLSSSAPTGLYFWKQSGSSSGSTTYYTTGASAATPTPSTTYTVSFSVPSGVSSVASQTATANSYITLPSAGAPSGYTFLGWVTSAVSSTTTRPSVLTGSYKVTGNITLRALYSYTTSSGSGSSYALVSSAPSSWTGKYVISYGSDAGSMYILKGLSGDNKYESSSNGSAVLLSNTGMSLSNNQLSGVSNAYVFDVAADGSYYTIRSAATGTYVSNYNYYLWSRSSYSSSAACWTLSCSNGNMTVKSSASSNYPYLSFYTGSKYFMIGSSVPSSLHFFKQTGSGSGSGTTPGGNDGSAQEPSTEAPTPEETPAPEPVHTCTIEIVCYTILNNMGNLNPAKVGFVPGNGVILSPTTVTYTPGETVFDVLTRVCATYGIQIEYSWTPMYNSYYIEGINNLYEFDCGHESGWMYKVNGWFPNYGCSSYTVSDGDSITWCFTCNGLGADVGGGYAA
ncbi:MAG: DUF4430 domain-containing protein, partial [Lachnospiraceae bacterium]|nr:DUF4430 domain-containing protein [Lachnospiraceae bacterium]